MPGAARVSLSKIEVGGTGSLFRPLVQAKPSWALAKSMVTPSRVRLAPGGGSEQGGLLRGPVAATRGLPGGAAVAAIE